MRFLVAFALCLALAGAFGRAEAATVRTAMLGSSPAIAARSAGDGDRVLVVIHGGPGAGSAHMRGMEVLADRGYRVVTYDQRGTGDSEAPPDPKDYAFDAYVRDLELVRQWTGRDKVTLLGHSWGGTVAMAYAAAHPEHVEGVILVDSSGADRGDDDAGVDAVLHAIRAMDEKGAPPPPPGLDPSCAGWWADLYIYYADKSRIRADDLPHHCSDDVNRATWKALGKYALSPALADVRVPSLILFGDHDPWRAGAHALRDAMRGTGPREVFLPACGHRPMFECPDAFYAEIDRFEASLDERRRGFQAWAASLGPALTWGGELPPRAPDDALVFSAIACVPEDGGSRRQLLLELADGRRWTVPSDDACDAPSAEPAWGDVAGGRFVVRQAGEADTVELREGRPVVVGRSRPSAGGDVVEDLVACASSDGTVPPECPRDGDVPLWDGHDDLVETSSRTVSGATSASFAVHAEPEADGYDVVLTTPPIDDRPAPDAPLRRVAKEDHFDVWFGADDVHARVWVDRAGAVHALLDGSPEPLPASFVNGLLRFRVAGVPGADLVVAFTDSDGHRPLGVAATTSTPGQPRAGRLYDPKTRFPAATGATPAVPAPGSPATLVDG